MEGEGRTWRGAGVDETGSWKSRGETMAGRRLRGRLINFFAFFDPHKLCRYTTTRRFAAGVKGLGFFPGERDGKGCGGEREVAPERTPRMYICTRNIYNEGKKSERARMLHEISHRELSALARDHAMFLTSLSVP